MSSRFFVGNIGHEATECELFEFFSKRGLHVIRVALVIDHATGHGRGFAFVEFDGAAEADAAIASLAGAQIDGRMLVLRHVDERDRADPRGRRRR